MLSLYLNSFNGLIKYFLNANEMHFLFINISEITLTCSTDLSNKTVKFLRSIQRLVCSVVVVDTNHALVIIQYVKWYDRSTCVITSWDPYIFLFWFTWHKDTNTWTIARKINYWYEENICEKRKKIIGRIIAIHYPSSLNAKSMDSLLLQSLNLIHRTQRKSRFTLIVFE